MMLENKCQTPDIFTPCSKYMLYYIQISAFYYGAVGK